AVAIDIDHFVLYAMRSGNWDPLAALLYDNFRKHSPRAGDTRPRYGSLRSIMHRAELSLPLLAAAACRWPLLRPIALGVALHLALDLHLPHFDWRAWRRAAGRCESCGVVRGDREVYLIIPPARGGARFALSNRVVWCGDCARRIQKQGSGKRRTLS
ncbi:MAG TPA: hypothetical protein PKC19_01455, partial [Roseiflexaceae bacterium]|nr:hypothetical protein [Roseiflexaceae bacterium]